MTAALRKSFKKIIPVALHPAARRIWRLRRAGSAGVAAVAATSVAAIYGGPMGAVTAACGVAVVALGLGLELRSARHSQAMLRQDVRRLRATISSLETTINELALSLWSGHGRSALRLPEPRTQATARALLARGHALAAYDLCAQHGLDSIAADTRGTLSYELRRRGYYRKALEVADAGPTNSPGNSSRGQRLAALRGEIAVLSGGFVPVVTGGSGGYSPQPGRLLHLVKISLPHTQTGYSVRTHYTVLAQAAAGLDPHVVTQMGYAHDGAGDLLEYVEGIAYHRLPGPARGSVPFDRWLANYVERVADLVLKVRPAVLHAASDYPNAIAAEAVGKAYGIPVVYESRGFWEETWLSRQAKAFGWNLPELEATHGLPDVYLWRREIEDRCRRNADRVVTLADVMADRIEAGGVNRDHIVVIPNAVDGDAFPVPTRNRDLAAELGISDETTVIGYISTIVEYEGIDTLIDAYAAIKSTTQESITLLIVGDGLERERLMKQATDLGLHDAIFTGRVPHGSVLDYYSLIDIFVVPRKPVEVCHLVTPLKPFEAFATARTVVLSNVRALAAIARESNAAELFEAGDPRSLADALTTLLHDPDRRRHLAQAGAQWVRTHRTWSANAISYLNLYDEMGAITARDRWPSTPGRGAPAPRSASPTRLDAAPDPEHQRTPSASP
jgi:glycosyltransferase involved in cell wall biosynthesis